MKMERLSKAIIAVGIILALTTALYLYFFIPQYNFLSKEIQAVKMSSPIPIKQFLVFGTGMPIFHLISWNQQINFRPEGSSQMSVLYNGFYVPVYQLLQENYFKSNSTSIGDYFPSLIDQKVYLNFISISNNSVSAPYLIKSEKIKGNQVVFNFTFAGNIDNKTALYNSTINYNNIINFNNNTMWLNEIIFINNNSPPNLFLITSAISSYEIEYNGFYFPASLVIISNLQNSAFSDTNLIGQKVYLDFISNNYKNASAPYIISKIYKKGNKVYWIFDQDTGISNESIILYSKNSTTLENSASQLNGVIFLNGISLLSPANMLIDKGKFISLLHFPFTYLFEIDLSIASIFIILIAVKIIKDNRKI